MDIKPGESQLTLFPDACFDIVAVAASAGGLKSIRTVLSGIPAGFPCALLIVQHLDPNRPSVLAEIISRASAVIVKQAEDGEQLLAGHAYIAPPDHHLLARRDGTLSLTTTERVHFSRPSADILFESVAASFARRAIAVVLSGTGRDGAHGVAIIKQNGGTIIAQDEASSEFFGMPMSAIGTGLVDYILPLSKIPQALLSLVMGGVLR